ncbi:NAD(P)H-hydrate dehydratase [Synechocystis sp. LKSZ1]|uniref:NAD(P)H-hydrate dehydratase n=1 Tax=Synechocystis sp. LKSZ1 TaxID=3144951 RepID=UPI00336C06B4
MVNHSALDSLVVSAAEMRAIEEYLFTQGMPVAALMEKAALAVAQRVLFWYPRFSYPTVGVLVGPGHNGGDGLVVARELALQQYQVKIYCPFERLKPLTQAHADYARCLGIPFVSNLEALRDCTFLIDAWFGFGLTRPFTGQIATEIDQLNTWPQPIVSIDIPSGLHTDSGAVLGMALRAQRSFCLGLWKRAYFQDAALAYLGQVERLDIGIPPQWIDAVLSPLPACQRFTSAMARRVFPQRPLVTHKYQQGHVLLICGSQRYAGGAILTALGARASGVGMVSVAVPQSLKPLLVGHCPEALVIACPETEQGAIASVPDLEAIWHQYQAVAIGPGLTTENPPLVEQVLAYPGPLILDADALNSLAGQGWLSRLQQRTLPTVLTPHLGELKRLFPHLENPQVDRLEAAQMAAQQSQALVLFKGARTIIAGPSGPTWIIAESTPALARGGSGDVLTGLMGGLLAQASPATYLETVALSAWWHAQAGILASQARSPMGVDALTLSQSLVSIAQQVLNQENF